MPEEFKILIADSDEYARKSMRKWVKRIANSKILEACSGFEAILTARDEMPDLILLDVLLDETDEYQAFKNIREYSQTKHIPIILLSFKDQEPYARAKALSFGASDYIAKPFYGPELLTRVQVLLISQGIRHFQDLKSSKHMIRCSPKFYFGSDVPSISNLESWATYFSGSA